jgi:5'-nucleotidase
MARILITNDDGVDAEGLHHLAAAVLAAGHDVVVAAPSYDASGSGASIGNLRPDHQIPCTPVELPGPNLRHVPAWSVDGPPALCVLAAALGGFGERPDLVVSGVNPGLNTGRVVLYSGTVGACLSAQNLGIRGLAVSLQATDPWRFDTAAAVAVEVLPLLEGAPERTVLNLNVPGVDRSEVRGVRWCRLASFGEVRAASAEVAEGALQMRVTAVDEEIPADSDSGSVRDGWAALTTIVGVVEAWPTPSPQAAGVTETVVPGSPVHPVHSVVDAFGGDAVLLPRAE